MRLWMDVDGKWTTTATASFALANGRERAREPQPLVQSVCQSVGVCDDGGGPGLVRSVAASSRIFWIGGTWRDGNFAFNTNR